MRSSRILQFRLASFASFRANMCTGKTSSLWESSRFIRRLRVCCFSEQATDEDRLLGAGRFERVRVLEAGKTKGAMVEGERVEV